MKAAKIRDTSPIATISGPGAIAPALAASSILKRSSAYGATFSSRPESTVEIGVGPSACASGSQACSGISPAFDPPPRSASPKAAAARPGAIGASRIASKV